jgi:hypothetical protein
MLRTVTECCSHLRKGASESNYKAITAWSLASCAALFDRSSTPTFKSMHRTVDEGPLAGWQCGWLSGMTGVGAQSFDAGCTGARRSGGAKHFAASNLDQPLEEPAVDPPPENAYM